MTIGVAIIGLGRIGFDSFEIDSVEGKIRSHTFAVLNQPGCHLVAGIDPDPYKRSRFEQATKAITFSSLTDVSPPILEKIDAFIVATPTIAQYEVLRELGSLENDYWVMCEKPMCSNLEEIVSLGSYIDVQKVIVNYSRRFSSDIDMCKSIFERFIKEMNAPLKVNFFGGMLRTASHFIDLANYWFLGQDSMVTAGMISKTISGYSINYPRAMIEFVSVDPYSNESFAEFILESNDTRISLVRDTFTQVTPSGTISRKILVSQEATIGALVELISSNGSRNRCSYSDALKVHLAMSHMTQLQIN
jgi:hypothetical protein